VREAATVGIKAAFEGVDMPGVQKYKNSIVSRMHKGLEGLVSSRGIDLIQGWGRLVAADAVEVDGRRITGRNVVLASGSYSKTIGQEISGGVITSEEALEMDHVPASAVILGGGVIGVEFASAWASMGSQVTIIEGLPHLVPNEDEAISKQLERAFRKRKITFRTNTMFESVERHDGGVTVRTQDGKTHEAEVLLIAVGRGPATANLGYEEVGVAMDRGFVLADEYGHTNVPGVWAVGDIVPGVQLAHRGFAQGIVVAEKIAGLDPTPVDDVLVPKVTFCEPEIASVGLSEAKAAEIHGKENITSAEFNVAGNAKSQILGTQGFVKLVSLKDGPILGFHAIGARMGEQVGEGQLMVSWEADADDVAALPGACREWNRATVTAVLRHHTVISEGRLRFEVSRHLGWPAQPLAYAVGERVWQAGRRSAQAQARTAAATYTSWGSRLQDRWHSRPVPRRRIGRISRISRVSSRSSRRSRRR